MGARDVWRSDSADGFGSCLIFLCSRALGPRGFRALRCHYQILGVSRLIVFRIQPSCFELRVFRLRDYRYGLCDRLKIANF